MEYLEHMTKIEFALLERLQGLFATLLPKIDVVIYLHSDPHIAFGRLQQRNRPEEVEIQPGLLEELHLLHEKWHKRAFVDMRTGHVEVVDTNVDFDLLKPVYHNLLLKFKEMLKNKRK